MIIYECRQTFSFERKEHTLPAARLIKRNRWISQNSYPADAERPQPKNKLSTDRTRLTPHLSFSCSWERTLWPMSANRIYCRRLPRISRVCTCTHVNRLWVSNKLSFGENATKMEASRCCQQRFSSGFVLARLCTYMYTRYEIPWRKIIDIWTWLWLSQFRPCWSPVLWRFMNVASVHHWYSGIWYNSCHVPERLRNTMLIIYSIA